MKILNISNMSLWLWGEGKGIPSTFYPQKGFAERGHEVHFLCPLRAGEKDEEISAGIHIHRFDFPFNFRQPNYFQTDTLWRKLRSSTCHHLNWLFFQFAALYQGLHLAKKIRPDLIYAHSPQSAYIAALISRIYRTKFILRLYGTYPLYRNRKNLFFRIKDFRNYFVFKLPAEYFIITDDGSDGDKLGAALGISPSRVRYWRNGIATEFFAPDHNAKSRLCQRLNLPLTTRMIVSTCRLINAYGVDQLLETCRILLPLHPDTVCVFAGSGPEQKRLEKFVLTHHLERQVFFLGIVDRAMIQTVLAASDIFVLASRMHNCTNTMWEAMARGCCIVTNESENIKKILTSGHDGVLLKDIDPEQLGKTLEELLNDEPRRNLYRQNVCLTARNVLTTWDDRVEKEIKLLEELIAK